MIAHRKFGASRPIHTSNFIPQIDAQECNGCGKCVNICPVEAMTLVSTNDPHTPKMKRAKVDEDLCLGCGVCLRVCSHDGIHLQARTERVITPLNTVHRTVLMAIERGGLQDLVFDNRVLWSHRSMAALLGVILKLPPLKRALANQQVKSRYLEALIERITL
jgi:ferredoxin